MKPLSFSFDISDNSGTDTAISISNHIYAYAAASNIKYKILVASIIATGDQVQSLTRILKRGYKKYEGDV